MNEELKAKLLTYLAHLEGAVKGTGDFVAEQAPLVVQEYVLYVRVVSSFWAAVGFLLLVFAAWQVRWLSKATDNQIHATARGGVAIFGLLIGATVGTGLTGANADRCLKSYVAPRILVLDYIKEQVK